MSLTSAATEWRVLRLLGALAGAPALASTGIVGLCILLAVGLDDDRANETPEEKEERCKQVRGDCAEECDHLMGKNFRPPHQGKRGRGRAGGGTNTQFEFTECYKECLSKNGC